MPTRSEKWILLKLHNLTTPHSYKWIRYQSYRTFEQIERKANEPNTFLQIGTISKRCKKEAVDWAEAERGDVYMQISQTFMKSYFLELQIFNQTSDVSRKRCKTQNILALFAMQAAIIAAYFNRDLTSFTGEWGESHNHHASRITSQSPCFESNLTTTMPENNLTTTMLQFSCAKSASPKEVGTTKSPT